MKYIKKFESFNVNETMDMMFMPVDPIAGAADMYSDIYKSIKDSMVQPIVKWLNEKGVDILNSVKPSKESLKKIYDFMMKNFGTISPDLNSENITKMIDALGLEKIKENNQEDEWHTVEGENIIVKILATLKYLFGLNIAGWFGLPAFVTGLFMTDGNGAIAALYWIGAFVVSWLLTKILEIFGYDGTDSAAVGRYDVDKDKFANRFKSKPSDPDQYSQGSYGKPNIPFGGLKKYIFVDGKIVEAPPVKSGSRSLLSPEAEKAGVKVKL